MMLPNGMEANPLGSRTLMEKQNEALYDDALFAGVREYIL